ncbi:MAG: hypothetical protein IJB52_10540 [Clostridia bacterium]|nr:hypothetical protein [Clostridia bacterium]
MAAKPDANKVPKWAVESLGRCVLSMAKDLCGDKRDTFRDPALQEEYELFKTNREEWERRYK